MLKIALAVALTALSHSAMANDNLLLQVKVFDGSNVIHDSVIRAVMGEESAMEVGTDVPYDTSVVVTTDGKTGRKTTDRVRGVLFDGIKLKVTPTSAAQSDEVFLTTDVRISSLKGFTAFPSAGETIQLPETTRFATRQKPRVRLGTTHVLEGTNEGGSFRVELTPTAAVEKSFQVD